MLTSVLNEYHGWMFMHLLMCCLIGFIYVWIVRPGSVIKQLVWQYCVFIVCGMIVGAGYWYFMMSCEAERDFVGFACASWLAYFGTLLFAQLVPAYRKAHAIVELSVILVGLSCFGLMFGDADGGLRSKVVSRAIGMQSISAYQKHCS